MGSSGQSRAGRPARRIRFRPVGAQTWDRVPSFRCRRLSLASDDPIWTLSRAETRGDGANLAMRLAFRAAGFDHEIGARALDPRSEEHTSELQSLMRISYAVFCLKKK